MDKQPAYLTDVSFWTVQWGDVILIVPGEAAPATRWQRVRRRMLHPFYAAWWRMADASETASWRIRGAVAVLRGKAYWEDREYW